LGEGAGPVRHRHHGSKKAPRGPALAGRGARQGRVFREFCR
jgi:hypothetical protein